GSAVSIYGSYFTGATRVRFGTLDAAFTVTTDSLITAQVPDAALTAPISVTTPGGTVTSDAVYEIVQVPIIISFTPHTGGAGTVVTIVGRKLTTTRNVSFAGQSALFHVASDSLLTATAPLDVLGGPITVETDHGAVA